MNKNPYKNPYSSFYAVICLLYALLRLAKWNLSGRWLVIFFTCEQFYTRTWLDVSLSLHVKYSKYRKQSLLYIVLIDSSLLFVSTARPMQLVEFNDPRSQWVNALLDVYFSTVRRTACTAFMNSRERANNPKALKAARLELGEKRTRLDYPQFSSARSLQFSSYSRGHFSRPLDFPERHYLLYKIQ